MNESDLEKKLDRKIAIRHAVREALGRPEEDRHIEIIRDDSGKRYFGIRIEYGTYYGKRKYISYDSVMGKYGKREKNNP